MSEPIRALISVSDKSGVAEFAKSLVNLSVEIISTGGTAKFLRDNGIDVTDVSEITGFPEIMDGRIKTLHPLVHGGLLARGNHDKDLMNKHNIKQINILAVNLYPFEKTISNPNSSLPDAIENIDIGGPSMIRSAAKNHEFITVVVDPKDYENIVNELKSNNLQIKKSTRFSLATKAFAYTACYDANIWNYLQGQSEETNFPELWPIALKRLDTLRYGENPHQEAALYLKGIESKNTLIDSKQLQGKPLSFNNLSDANTAYDCVQSLEKPACVIVKHANPCGAAVAKTSLGAYQKAYACDPTSAFGGIIAFNERVNTSEANEIVSNQFVEVILAPSFEPEAIKIFSSKPNIRVIEYGDTFSSRSMNYSMQQISNGMLIQEADKVSITESEIRCVTKRNPTQEEIADALLAWKVVRYVKSNAIVYGKNNATLGIGAGQMSRIMSAQIAGQKAAEAKLNLNGAVMASDAFFPFRDGIDVAANLGIKVVIQPGGSIRDEEVIAAADAHEMTMLFTGIRHFRH